MNTALNLKTLKTADTRKKFNQDRKEAAVAAGTKAVQKDTRLGAPSTLKHFPTDQEIEAFQAQLNSESIKSLAEAFKNSAVTSLKQKIPLGTF